MKPVAAAAAFAALVSLALPLHAQTGSVWHDQKMFDMKSHQRNKDFDSRASGHYEMALAEAETIETLVKVEDRSKRQEKRLQKAYGRAVEHLEEAVAVSPDFVAARLMLGAIHFKMQEYRPAQAAYQGVLEIDPENQDARAFLQSVNWHLERAGGASTTEPSGS